MGRRSSIERAYGGLTPVEREELERHEGVIRRGMETFREVGNSLMAIRDRRLYRETHGTFESYCRERWGFTRQRAHQLIGSAAAAEDVSTIVDVDPVNEAQARPLARLKGKELRQAAWKTAFEGAGGKPTAADVERAVAAVVVSGDAVERTGMLEEAIAPYEELLRRVALLEAAEPNPYVWSAQRSAIAVKYWKLRSDPEHWRYPDFDRDHLLSLSEEERDDWIRDRAAHSVGVSAGSMVYLRAIDETSPDLFEAIWNGEMTLREAEERLGWVSDKVFLEEAREAILKVQEKSTLMALMGLIQSRWENLGEPKTR